LSQCFGESLERRECFRSRSRVRIPGQDRDFRTLVPTTNKKCIINKWLEASYGLLLRLSYWLISSSAKSRLYNKDRKVAAIERSNCADNYYLANPKNCCEMYQRKPQKYLHFINNESWAAHQHQAKAIKIKATLQLLFHTRAVEGARERWPNFLYTQMTKPSLKPGHKLLRLDWATNHTESVYIGQSGLTRTSSTWTVLMIFWPRATFRLM